MPNKNVITTERFDHPVNIYFHRTFLEVLRALQVYDQFATPAMMPMHEGDTYKWRRMTALAAATTPLDEVNDPEFEMLEKTDLQATLKQYGSGVKTSAWKDMTGITQDKDAITTELVEQARLTIDTLARNVAAGTASSTTCSNGSGTETLLNKTDIDTVTKNMGTNNVPMITQQISAGRGQGTTPIRRGYIGLCHTDLVPDVRAVAGFKDVSTYPGGGGYEGEIGSTGDLRWVRTSNAYTSGGYYYCLILGRGFFGKVDIKGEKTPLIYHNPKEAGSAFEMYGTLVWKLTKAYRILNDLCGHALLCTSNY